MSIAPYALPGGCSEATLAANVACAHLNGRLFATVIVQERIRLGRAQPYLAAKFCAFAEPMKRDLYLTLNIDCDEGESIAVEPRGEEHHVIAARGRYRNLIARVVPVNPPVPVVAAGKSVSRMVQRQRELAEELRNAPPIKPRRRGGRLATN